MQSGGRWLRNLRSVARAPAPVCRTFATGAVVRDAVKLAYEVQEPPSSGGKVATHTDSLQNWRSLAKGMAKDYGVPIYTVDLRNHGASPHVDSMTYRDMASDVERFFDDHKLKRTALIGHSLGGKVVMALALNPHRRSDMLSHLVSVDMSPAEGPISPEFMVRCVLTQQYARTMLEIDQAGIESRNEADKILQKVESNLGVRQFLLTNLERSGDKMRFRIPVQTMLRSLDEIGRFPYAPGADGAAPERQWEGPTLFIKGAKSKYINPHNTPLLRAYFPRAELIELPTGHWCQSEEPRKFMEDVRAFLERN